MLRRPALWHTLASLILTVSLVLASAEAHATTYSWNVASGDWFTPGNWSPTGTPGLGDNVTISNGGTCTLDAAVSINDFTLSTLAASTLTGSGTLTVNGLLTWTSGIMSGTGTTNANGGIALAPGAGVTPLLHRTLNNAGTAIVTGTGIIWVDNQGGTGILNNLAGATLDVQGDAGFSGFLAHGVINSTGLLQKSSGSGTSAISCRFNNTGTVAVQSGTLDLKNNGTHTGGFTVATGATLRFNGGTHGLSAAASITGGGNVVVLNTSTTVNHAGSFAVSGATTVSAGTANFTGSVTAIGALTIDGGTANFSNTDGINPSTLTLASGTLSGSSNVNVSGLLTWTGGIMAGTGVTNGNGGMVLAANGGPILRRTMNNAGTAAMTGTDSFRIDFTGPGVLNNLAGGTMDVQTDASFAGVSAPGTINNAGLFQKSGGSGTSSVLVKYFNAGMTTSNSGLLSFGPTYTQTAGATRLNGGNVSSTVTMSIQGGVLEGTGTLTATVNNIGGTLAPGSSAGQLDETGAYTQSANGSFTVEIGGLTAGTQYDRAAISGLATLAGTLNVTLIDGYEPNVGDTFTIMTFSSRTGDFGTVNGTFIAPGKSFLETVSGTHVDLVVVAVATPTPTNATVTATPTTTSTPTVTPTPTPTETSTVAATRTVTPTSTGTPTPTVTPTPTTSRTPTLTATLTGTMTPTATESPTPSVTSTPTPTATAGVCGDGFEDPGEQCDDGNLDDDDGCSATCMREACRAAPSAGCRTGLAGKGQLKIRWSASDPNKHQVRWKWAKGAKTLKTDFGLPNVTEAYHLCLYDAGVLISTTRIEAGGTCAGRPCWKESSKGFQFRDKERTPDGAQQLKLQAGGDSKAEVQIKGAGANLDVPDAASLVGPVVVQLKQASHAVCWGATYSVPFLRHDGASFFDTSD
jgi:cysteine-rich repeat protein